MCKAASACACDKVKDVTIRMTTSIILIRNIGANITARSTVMTTIAIRIVVIIVVSVIAFLDITVTVHDMTVIAVSAMF